MRIRVVVIPEARRDLLDLLSARAPSSSDAILFAQVYLDDMEERFTRHHGLPPGSRRVRQPDGSEYWWRYVNGVWVAFRLADVSGWLFGAAVRTVTVTGFATRPPSP